MWENIVVILLIISFSYLFRQTGTNMGANNKKINTFDTQMLFILLSLGSLIFYKMTFINKLEKKVKTDENTNTQMNEDNNENFTNNISAIVNDFSQSNSPITSNTTQEQQTINPNMIRDELQNMRNIINNLAEQKEEQKVNLEGQEINEQNLIAFQNLQLNNLEKTINDIQKNRLDLEDKEISKTFKKIPVYNSCYVINADNSVSNTNGDSLAQQINSDDTMSSSEQSNIINQVDGGMGSQDNISVREQNIKNMTERLDKLEDFFGQLMSKFTNIKLLV